MSKKLTANQQAWVDALRSGKYKQTKYSLQDELGFCCLGVACVVAENAGVNLRLRTSDNSIAGGSLSDQPEVQRWLGLKTGTGEFEDNIGLSHLVELNDIYSKTFPEIADIIEANARSLFND